MARPRGIKNIYDAGMTGLGPEDLRQNAQTFDTNLSNESIPNPNSPASRTFRQTNLDLEDARVLGGPNRTDGGGDGFYTVQGDNSDNPLSVGGVPLRNDDGTFGIISETGDLYVLKPENVDYEAKQLYSLGITVSDGFSTSAEEIVEIKITDSPNAFTMDNFTVNIYRDL